MHRQHAYRGRGQDTLLEAELLARDVCGSLTENDRLRRAYAEPSAGALQAAADGAPATGGKHLEAAKLGPAL